MATEPPRLENGQANGVVGLLCSPPKVEADEIPRRDLPGPHHHRGRAIGGLQVSADPSVPLGNVPHEPGV